MELLRRDDVLLIFTYAPAGLGHLRVTDALYDGLPKEINSVLMGSDDTRITYWHRVMSVSPWVRETVEWIQERKYGYRLYDFYIWLLQLSTKKLYREMEKLIISQWQQKKTIVIVSTHFGLAHQIGKIKDRLEKNLKIKIILIFQVTDATSMEILYIPEADLICVPSKKVKTELLKSARARGIKETRIEVLPYPLSQTLSKKLTEKEFDQRVRQYSYDSESRIKIAVPISGAAVGLDYYEQLITKLHKSSERFFVYLVAKNNIHTSEFIRKMKTRDYVKVIVNDTDKKVVDSYEQLYDDEVIAMEIVKPSEQAFKSLFDPKQKGGSILLLTAAVGKQEHDNLEFLAEHQLVPDKEDEKGIIEENNINLSERSKHWRGIRLTNDPTKDIKLINWCLKVGIFEQMAKAGKKTNSSDNELASDGVEQFWKKVNSLFN